MELRHIRYFIAVAEEGSFTKAAQRLSTAQPSLSRQIRDLEHELGVALFTRSTRSVSLTAAGAAFLNEARLVIAQATRAVEAARTAAGVGEPQLSIGVLQGAGIGELIQTVKTLQATHPHLDLTLQSRSSPELIAEVSEAKVDAAFVRPSAQSAHLNERIVRRETLIAAVPSGHRLAGRSSIELADLRDEVFVRVARELAPVLVDAVQEFLRDNAVPDVQWAYESENVVMALSLVASAGAVGLLPESYESIFPRGVSALRFSTPSPSLNLALVWHPNNKSALLQEFLALFGTLT